MTIATAEIVKQVKISCQIPGIKRDILAREIVAKKAQAESVQVEISELQIAADEFRAQQNLWTADDTWSWLEIHDLSLPELEEIVHNKLLNQKLAQHLFADKIEAFFVENKLNYTQVAMSEIVLDDHDFAMELFFAIQEGEMSFTEAANQYIEDPVLRRRGGYQGQVPRLHLRPEISAAVFAANPPELLKPITIGKQVHLILVEEIIEPELTDELRGQILEGLFVGWVNKEIKEAKLPSTQTLVGKI